MSHKLYVYILFAYHFQTLFIFYTLSIHYTVDQIIYFYATYNMLKFVTVFEVMRIFLNIKGNKRKGEKKNGIMYLYEKENISLTTFEPF